MYILRNCRLVKELTEGYESQLADILIDGRLIKEIKEPNHKFDVRCEEIDIKNKTVMPGLFDLHCHLGMRSLDTFRVLAMKPIESAFGAYAFAKEYLRQGYTTIRDCGSNFYIAAGVRDAINKGILVGPRVFASGLIVTPTEIGNETFGPLYVEADGVDEMTKACRNEFKNGADYIKLMATGAFFNEGANPGELIITFDEVKACVEMAKLKNSYVAAHCHGTEGIKLCIKAGVRTIEHSSFIDDEGIELLKSAPNCYLVPTHGIDKIPYDYPESIGVLCDENDRLTKLAHSCLRKAYDAGIKLGFGSDVDYEHIKALPGYEFIARKEMLGYSEIEILKQATIYSAACIGLEDKLGTIKEGKLADLIVVDGNPDEDVYVMQKDLLHVFKEGARICL